MGFSLDPREKPINFIFLFCSLKQNKNAHLLYEEKVGYTKLLLAIVLLKYAFYSSLHKI